LTKGCRQNTIHTGEFAGRYDGLRSGPAFGRLSFMNLETRANTLTGAEAMVRMLEAYGVKHIFGLCGDTTLPFCGVWLA
jgi:hypothetical protein